MSNYTQTTFFAPKDALLSGNPAKLIRGADVDPELAAIATAIASKYDSSSIASAPVGFQAGSVGSPAIYLGASTHTGLYLSATDTLAVTTASTLRLSVNATGNIVVAAPTSGVALSVTALAGTAASGILATGDGLPIRTQLLTSGGYSGVRFADQTGARQLDLAFIGSTAAAAYGAPAGSSVLNSGGTGGLTLATNDLPRLFVNGTGNVTVNAPSSGVGLQLNGIAASANSMLDVIAGSNGAAVMRFQDGQTGTRVWQLEAGNPAVGNFRIRDATRGADVVVIGTTGNVSVNAPSSGSALAISGLSGSIAALVTGGATTGSSLGLVVRAGTNSSDTAFQVSNQTAGADYFQVRGDGVVRYLGGSQPAFNVQRITSAQVLTNSAVNDLIFNGANLNQSSGYSTGTGIFTAPVAGLYLFTATVDLAITGGSGAVSINNIFFSRNNSTAVGGNLFEFSAGAYPTGLGVGVNWRTSGSVVTQLAAGDTVRVKADMGGSTGGTANLVIGAFFTGYLLG